MTGLRQLLAAAPCYAALLRSQYRPAAEIAAATRARLDETLRRAAAIPFYADRLGAAAAAADLERLPVLRRADIPELGRSARAVSRPGACAGSARTSGTTGASAEFLFDAGHQRGRFAARARYLAAHGWQPFARSAWLIELRGASPDGDLVARRRILGARFGSHLDPFDRQLEWLAAIDPRYVFTVPSNLEGLLDVIEERGRRLPRLAAIFTSGEVVADSLRLRARRVLAVEIADNYGSTEAALAWQCPLGSLHVNAEHVAIEVVDDANHAVAPGTVGKILVTTLENFLMPLVRYEIGDYAIAADGACRCGRGLPRLGRVIGREMNLFRLRDGRRLSPWKVVDAAKTIPGLRHFQIIQRAIDRYVIRFVADEPPAAEVESTIRDAFAAEIGERVAVGLERVAEPPRTPAGKLMTTICEVR